ncbi:hypothetical protein BH20VER3_BH20VER3_00350 [soil metagenome]
MILSRRSSAFALAVTLVLMALIVIVIVAYLANTRTDRSTSSIYANQLRARMVADSGLAAATKLLADNTRYGNYITAMPAPVPSPANLYTELYRPTDPADTKVAKADDFLKLTNASGVILTSRATASATSQVDSRPTPVMIPSAGPFAIADPGFISADSYDFNQIVRLGTNANGRLVKPMPTPAYGQWVRVRNSNNELIGRYAFFMEDESMKTNVNVTGNNLSGGSNLRINDLALPLPTPAPATQLEEVDPAAVLPVAANRSSADTALTGVAAAGSRLATRSSLALLNEWNSNFSDYAHLVTAMSKDDQTTAKGWRRLDLNALVAAATDNTAKVAVANRIADWIRDAWTGPDLGTLANYQMFNDSRLRQQIAANIVDYIDADDIPTDMGDIVPPGYVDPVPVLGIEKIPYLIAIEVIYEASGSNGTSSCNLKMKLQFRFINLSETDLDLANSVGHIEVSGVPIVSRNGVTVFDVSATNYVIQFADLTATNPLAPGTVVPAGIEGTGDSGAKTLQTDWLADTAVTFNGSGNIKPVFLAGKITAKVFGLNGERLDDTAVVTNLLSTGYQAPSSGSTSTGDFLKDSTTTAYKVASINLIYTVPPGATAPINTGDPRLRGPLISDRWYNLSRTDASLPTGASRIDTYIDKAEINTRSYAFDWYDYVGDRPLAFHRNGPMRSVGELGNVSAGEYPWRTLYLQYPERPVNTTQPGPVTEIPLRRSSSVDYILADLFRTETVDPRPGGLNINTQQRLGTQQHPLAPLFLAELIGAQPSLTQTMVDRLCDATGSTTISPIFNRRVAVGSPPDNTPLRPFFQIGELASTMSRIVNTSANTTTGSPSRSTVTYSMLRTTPTTASQINPNYRTDNLAEQEFREISNSITTRGNVFRVLYLGQSLKDLNGNGTVDANEVQSEYLGEAFVERQGVFQPEGTNPDANKTADSTYKVVANRIVTQ